MFNSVFLPLPSHMAFAQCVTSWCAGPCAVQLQGHSEWSQGTMPASAQLTQMQVHTPASGMSTLDLIFSLALHFCIAFLPEVTQRASEKEVMQEAPWSQLQKLVFLKRSSRETGQATGLHVVP